MNQMIFSRKCSSCDKPLFVSLDHNIFTVLNGTCYFIEKYKAKVERGRWNSKRYIYEYKYRQEFFYRVKDTAILGTGTCVYCRSCKGQNMIRVFKEIKI